MIVVSFVEAAARQRPICSSTQGLLAGDYHTISYYRSSELRVLNRFAFRTAFVVYVSCGRPLEPLELYPHMSTVCIYWGTTVSFFTQLMGCLELFVFFVRGFAPGGEQE